MSSERDPVQDVEIRRQLLEITLKNARRSVALLLLAGCFVAWRGWQAGLQAAGGAVAALAVGVSLWRWWLGGREAAGMTAAAIERSERELAGNALLAGLLWALTTALIYPALEPRYAIEYIAIVVGSAATAAHFLTLIRHAYGLLVIPSMGTLALVSAAVPSVHSPSLVWLSLAYVVTLLVAGRIYRRSAAASIQHAIELGQTLVELRRAKEVAEAAADARSRFLATMSHEIRTPMNGVLGSLEMLRRAGLSSEQKQLARTAASSGHSLMTLLDDVLDHAKIEANHLELVAEPMSLHDLAQSVEALFRSNADRRGLALRLDLRAGVPDGVIGDAQRLRQVLTNLVSNAIKYTDRGQVELAIGGFAADGHALLSFEVRDTGIGLDDEAIARLFAPFVQIDEAGARTRSGTGLGLSIAQRLVEAMGSRITVRSVVGSGSTFAFELRLPLAPERQSLPPAAPEPMSTISAPAGIGATVLVVEDNVVNRLVARTMLESLGHRVIEAHDGQAALDAVPPAVVDLVLMDCRMPRMDGFEATRRWRERERQSRWPRVPILALTANAYAEDIAEVIASGMDGHLSKPYTRAQLRLLLDQWLSPEPQGVTAPAML